MVASTNTRQFTGHERDRDTGMDYMLARYYGSSLGRFTSPDPERDTRLHDPLSWNKYTYVSNNPLRYSDPLGMVLTDSVEQRGGDRGSCRNLPGGCADRPREAIGPGPGCKSGGAPCDEHPNSTNNPPQEGSEREVEGPQRGGPDDPPHPKTGFDPRNWRYDPNRNYDPNDPSSRPGRWVPIGPGGPNISWDPIPGRHGEPHWDVNDGKGGRRWVAPDGRELKTAVAVGTGAIGAYIIYRIGKAALGCAGGPIGCAAGALTP